MFFSNYEIDYDNMFEISRKVILVDVYIRRFVIVVAILSTFRKETQKCIPNFNQFNIRI